MPSELFTGLGIAAVTIGMALQVVHRRSSTAEWCVQTFLKDLFGSISIFLTTPFVVGDFVDIDAGKYVYIYILEMQSEMSGRYEGNILNVGLRTTSVRLLNQGQVTSNN